jgi:hypothetical protein
MRSLIYPVPDPSLPFLGVHRGRYIDGELVIGQTALIAGARDAYRLVRVRREEESTRCGGCSACGLEPRTSDSIQAAALGGERAPERPPLRLAYPITPRDASARLAVRGAIDRLIRSGPSSCNRGAAPGRSS